MEQQQRILRRLFRFISFRSGYCLLFWMWKKEKEIREKKAREVVEKKEDEEVYWKKNEMAIEQ